MTETTVGREPVQIVEIQQPLCAEVFGASPCTATGSADKKCYNTRATCKDTANFDLGAPLSLFFAKGNVAERGISGVSYLIPSLVSVSTSPTKINLSGADRNASSLGNRAVCTITFADHPHTDRVVDPYLSGRTFDPMARNSFWTKWLARNKYRQNMLIKVYEGYAGQALSAMNVRQFVLDGVPQLRSGGGISIRAKDILAKVEERKAKAPSVSPGELFADIDISQLSVEVAGALLSEYGASGTIRIDGECLTYSTVANSANGITFTITARGTDGTTAKEHDAETHVQECLRFTGSAIDDVINSLLGTYAGIAAGYLDTAGWAAEVDTYATAYLLTTLITEPISVAQLVSEIQEQASCFVWWDEREAKVKLRIVRGVTTEPDLLTAETNILAGSFSIQEKPNQRVSQVWFYYDQRDPTKGLDPVDNWKNVLITANLESETDELYGEPSIRTIRARWINSSALALSTSSRIATRYIDNPRQCRFQLDAKDRGYWAGDTVRISHFLDSDEFGENNISSWTITSAEEIKPGEIVEYVAVDTSLYGIVSSILANGTADYQGDGTDQYNGMWISDANGLYSNGDKGARLT